MESSARYDANVVKGSSKSLFNELCMVVDSGTTDLVLDIEGTLARFGGDRQLFLEMSGILLEDTPRLFAELAQVVAARDAAAIRSGAHALKGLLAGCGGLRAARVAQSL